MNWTKTKTFKRHYELREGDRVVASLKFEGLCGSLATAQAGKESWTLKRSGFLRPRVTVRQAGSEAELAVFEPRWTGSGTLRFADGRTFQWEHLRFWSSQWGWTRGNEQILVRINANLTGSRAKIEMEAGVKPTAETLLLVIVGWYLQQLMNQDAASAVVITG